MQYESRLNTAPERKMGPLRTSAYERTRFRLKFTEYYRLVLIKNPRENCKHAGLSAINNETRSDGFFRDIENKNENLINILYEAFYPNPKKYC